MKRKMWIAWILAAVMILCCVGCGTNPARDPEANEKHTGDGEQAPLRICCDLGSLGFENESPDYSYESAVEGAVQGLMLEVMTRGGADDYVIEVIPKEEAARKSVLTKLRTEIMSGEGPDVFIMGCDGSPYGSLDMLFPIPEKAMENSLFLPLDAFMANNTQFTEWDKLQREVLRAGCSEEGQLIIPISYTLPVTFYRSAETDLIPDENTAWNDMLCDETGVLSSAACWFNMSEGLLHMRGSYIEYTFGQLADYGSEELLFSEAELMQRAEEIRALNEKCEQGDSEAVPAHYKTCLSVDFNNETGGNLAFMSGISAAEDPFAGIKPTETQRMIPIYTDDGGASAAIIAYAAVNINTQRPDDAFTVIDVLMDLETQRKSVLYENWFTSLYGIPMHDELLQPACPALYTAKGKPWYLREENYKELCRVRGQITSVRFRGCLDMELKNAYYAYEEAVRTGEKNLEEAVHEIYRRMERLLSE